MKPLHGIVLLLGIWLGAPAAQGAGFRQLYDAALAHDPGFRAARQELLDDGAADALAGPRHQCPSPDQAGSRSSPARTPAEAT